MSAITIPVELPPLRRTLPPSAAFAGTAVAFGSLYLAAGAPTPLLVQFESAWGFPAWLLTVAFAAYAIGLLAALVVAGSLSDFIGRRPVLIGALVLELVSMLTFLAAQNIAWVIVARVLQGIATGAASSAFSASLLELAPAKHRKLSQVIGGTAATAGLGLGALLSGVAVQFAPNASEIVFTVLSALVALGILVAIFSAETTPRRSGAVRSLVPRVSVARAARTEFVAVLPSQIAAWMLAGLFIGLVPTIIRSIFHIDSGLLNGATAFVEPAAASLAGLFIGRLITRHVLLIGGAGVFVGAIVIVAGIVLGAFPLLLVGGIIGGVGFGASFTGTFRAVTPLVEQDERAAVYSAVFVVAYLAFGIPAIIAGQLVSIVGLLPVIVGYAATIAIAAGIGVIAQLRLARAVAVSMH